MQEENVPLQHEAWYSYADQPSWHTVLPINTLDKRGPGPGPLAGAMQDCLCKAQTKGAIFVKSYIVSL